MESFPRVPGTQQVLHRGGCITFPWLQEGRNEKIWETTQDYYKCQRYMFSPLEKNNVFPTLDFLVFVPSPKKNCLTKEILQDVEMYDSIT